MAGEKMMPRLAAGIVLLALSAHGAGALTSAATDAPEGDAGADGSPAVSAIWEKPAAPVQIVGSPATPAPVPERVLSANPLWAIPLTALSGTRERPIFSSSRRPPAPAVAQTPMAKSAAAPKPREPERPQLSLVGTIAGSDERFGLFLDQSTKAAIRLKMGEDYQGWRLRSVLGREATLEKDRQIVILALPQSGAGQPPSEDRSALANAGKLLSVNLRPRPDRSGR
jgi:general secretion pathway protein N